MLCLVAQSYPPCCNPMDCSPQAPLSTGVSRQEYWSGLPCRSPGHLPNPRDRTQAPALQVDFLLSELPGKPKDTGVWSLSLLQGIFPTQESNQGLLDHRRVLYQLSYQRSTHMCAFSLSLSLYIYIYIYIHTHIYKCICIYTNNIN